MLFSHKIIFKPFVDPEKSHFAKKTQSPTQSPTKSDEADVAQASFAEENYLAHLLQRSWE